MKKVESILGAIEKRKARLRPLPLFAWLRNSSMDGRRRLEFAPAMHTYLMGFREVLEVLRRKVPANGDEKDINTYVEEDARHWLWYVQDLERMGYSVTAWGEDLPALTKGLYGDPSRIDGKTTTYLKMRAADQHPINILSLIWIFEATGDVFLEHTRMACTDAGLNKVFQYFGDHHFEEEQKHTVDPRDYASRSIDDALHAYILESVETAFDMYECLFEDWYQQALASPYVCMDARTSISRELLEIARAGMVIDARGPTLQALDMGSCASAALDLSPLGGQLAPVPAGVPELQVLALMATTEIPAADIVEALRVLGDDHRKNGTEARSLYILGARVVGRVSLYAGRIDVPLRLVGCQIAEGIALHQATISSLELSGSFVGAFQATGLEVNGNVRLVGTCIASIADFNGSKFHGQLDLTSAVVAPILPPPRVDLHPIERGAINLALCEIDGTLKLNGALIVGGLVMLGARVGRTIYAQGLTVYSPEFAAYAARDVHVALRKRCICLSHKERRDFAYLGEWLGNHDESGSISSHRSEISPRELSRISAFRGGGMRVTSNAHFEGAEFFGAVRFRNAQFEGSLLLSGGKCYGRPEHVKTQRVLATPPRGEDVLAIQFTNADVDGDIDLTGREVRGTIEFNSTHVHRSVHMTNIVWSPGGPVYCNESYAVIADGAEVDANVHLADGQQAFRLAPDAPVGVYRIQFKGAKVGGDFRILFEPERYFVLRAQGMKVSGGLMIEASARHDEGQDEFGIGAKHLPPKKMQIDLRGASASIFEHQPGAWPARERLVIENMTYQLHGRDGPFLGGAKATPEDLWLKFRRYLWPVKNRGIAWLELQARHDGVAWPDKKFIPLQPYSQAARALRAAGMMMSSNQVERSRVAEQFESYDPISRFFGKIADLIAGYGYELGKMLLFVLIIVASGIGVAYAAIEMGVLQLRDECPAVDDTIASIALSLDLFLPALEFGATDCWTTTTAISLLSWGGAAALFLNFIMPFLGYVSLTILIAVVSGRLQGALGRSE